MNWMRGLWAVAVILTFAMVSAYVATSLYAWILFSVLREVLR